MNFSGKKISLICLHKNRRSYFWNYSEVDQLFNIYRFHNTKKLLILLSSNIEIVLENAQSLRLSKKFRVSSNFQQRKCSLVCNQVFQKVSIQMNETFNFFSDDEYNSNVDLIISDKKWIGYFIKYCNAFSHNWSDKYA